MSVAWSASSEWVLITGGCDGAIRFWDIRRAGCFRVLDQSQSQLGRRPPISGWTANKVPPPPPPPSLALIVSTSSFVCRLTDFMLPFLSSQHLSPSWPAKVQI